MKVTWSSTSPAPISRYSSRRSINAAGNARETYTYPHMPEAAHISTGECSEVSRATGSIITIAISSAMRPISCMTYAAERNSPDDGLGEAITAPSSFEPRYWSMKLARNSATP